MMIYLNHGNKTRISSVERIGGLWDKDHRFMSDIIKN